MIGLLALSVMIAAPGRTTLQEIIRQGGTVLLAIATITLLVHLLMLLKSKEKTSLCLIGFNLLSVVLLARIVVVNSIWRNPGRTMDLAEEISGYWNKTISDQALFYVGSFEKEIAPDILSKFPFRVDLSEPRLQILSRKKLEINKVDLGEGLSPLTEIKVEDDSEKTPALFLFSGPGFYTEPQIYKNWITIRRAAAIIRHTPGDLIVIAHLPTSIFSNIYGTFSFVARVENLRRVTQPFANLFSWDGLFVLGRDRRMMELAAL